MPAVQFVPERALAERVRLPSPPRMGLSLDLKSYWDKVGQIFRLKYLVRQNDIDLYRRLFFLRKNNSRDIREMLALIDDARYNSANNRPIVKNDISRMLPLYVSLLSIAQSEPRGTFHLIDIGCSYGFHSLFNRAAFHFTIGADRRDVFVDNAVSPFLAVSGRIVGIESIGALNYSRFTYVGVDPFGPNANKKDDVAWLEVNTTFAAMEEVDVFRESLAAAAATNDSILRARPNDLQNGNLALSGTVVLQHSCSWHQMCGPDRTAIHDFLEHISAKLPAYEVGLIPISPTELVSYVRLYRGGRCTPLLRAVWYEQSNMLKILRHSALH